MCGECNCGDTRNKLKETEKEVRFCQCGSEDEKRICQCGTEK